MRLLLSSSSRSDTSKMGMIIMRRSHFFSFLLFHTLLLTQICLADPKSQDASCATNEFRCDCGVIKCVDKSLVKDGVKDCADGSDEGEWDPSKCAIKNRTSEDIRFKRAAIPELGNSDATTTFFSHERARTRPVGLLSTSLGAFVTSGTTTEYLTKVLGTYIKGTYARIISTSSKVYHAVPTEQAGGGNGEARPTGFIASTTSSEINGYATTVHSTDFYRTYIDGSYVQLVSSSSNIKYPSWYTDRIEGIEPTSSSGEGKVYPTQLPAEVRGSFVNNNVIQSKAYAEVGIVSEDNSNPGNLKFLRPNNNAANELKVTGTHGKFVHADQDKGDETTYNVFTGSYTQNSKTFLFFFGNTVIDPTRVGDGAAPPTLTVETGRRPENSVMVDMSKSLKVVVPSANSRVKVDGSIGGESMPGVLVEIEGSESGDDFISVDGAKEMGTPSDPRIDMITMTLGDSKVRVSSSSSSSRSGEQENEILQGRKVPDSISPAKAEQLSLPTFTVGQPDTIKLVEDTTTPKVADMLVDSSTQNPVRSGAPVFLKTTEKVTPRSTDRIRALGYTQKKSSSISASNLNGKYPMPNRNHRAFSGFDAATKMNDMDNDLAGAASTGRATVTYVGFADFTTTVGNTVIVFMPRTKMIEDLSVHASATETTSSQQIEPTRYVYHTGNGDETTTGGSRDEDHIQFSVSQVQGRKVSGKSKKVSFKDDEDEETTTELNPTESSISGRETVILGSKSSVQNKKIRPSSTISSSSDRRNSLFSSPRAKFTPKGKEVSPSSTPGFSSVSPSVFQTAFTTVFQTGVLNPTGLVTSVDGTIVRDGKTTLYTSNVYGTFIGKSYAQVIKSTSRVVKASSIPTATRSAIRPTSVAKLPGSKSSKSVAPVYYEFSTTTQSSDSDDVETTTSSSNGREPDRMEVSVTSTTEKNKDDDDIHITTVGSVNLEDSFDDDDDVTTTTTTTTSTTEKASEADNEIGQKRKVAGNAKDQIIVDLEPSPLATLGEDDQEDQTVYVTRTLPTTVYRTYTYYTTFFIPEEGTTSTKVVSREVTSSAVGLVRKTFTNIVPTTSTDASDVEAKPSVEVIKPGKRIRGKDGGAPAQVIYKTLYTTYTYLTTFFSGETSSVASREETVSNVITVTSSLGIATTKSVDSPKITPTSSLARSRTGYKTISPRLSSTVVQGGNTPNVGISSPSPLYRSRGRSSTILRQKVPLSSTTEVDDDRATDEIEYQSVTKTLLRTFMTTFTYFTTLFNGEDTSIKSRTEVITNVVPYVTKTLAPIIPSVAPASKETTVEEYDDDSDSSITKGSKSKVKETTVYTTYTYVSSILKGKTSTVKTSKQTYTNIIVEDVTIRSGYVEPIEPTKLVGRSVGVGKATRTPKLATISANDVESEDGDDVTTLPPHPEYELEGSEDVGVTTNKPDSYDDGDDEDNDVNNEKTPLLKTLYTTYTFYTTFYKGGSSTVSSRLETKSQVVTDTAGLGDETEDVTVTDKAPLLSTIDPTYPVTYFTTYTFWTTSFKDGNSIVTSREETLTNVVTPIAPSASSSVENNEILPSSSQEIDLTTFYTTYTYFTTSYLGEKTVVNSRLETVTNVITGTVASPVISPTQTGRAIGTVKPVEQKVHGNDKDEYEDYATGLLSTIVSSSVRDGTTTVFSTDVFGTLIDGIYAQVLESTSKVIQPSAAAFTRFFPEASESVTGVVSVNEGKTVEAGKDRTVFYATTAYGTVIDGQYAHLVESTSSVKGNHLKTLEPSEEFQKTGLVRIIDGTLVEGDHTTFYTSSIVGTFVDGQYAQVIESTSRFTINPTKTEEPGASKTVFVDVESSVTESSSSDDEDSVTTTTEKGSKEQEEEVTTKKNGIIPPRRFGSNRDRSSSRLSFTATSKTNTPSITPFASRSRPSGFTPRKRTSSIGILATKTEDVSSSSQSSTVPSRGFQAKRRFQKPGGDSNNVNADGTTTPTPALPASRSRGNGRFTKPVVGGGKSSRFEKPSSASISPSSVSGSSAGSRGRSSSFPPRGSSAAGGGRSRSTTPGVFRGSSTAGVRATSSSRFVPGRGRSSSSFNPSATQATTVTPTQISSSPEYESEYEYETSSRSSTTTAATTESPRGNRFGGGNRFRLSTKLSTPVASDTTTLRPSTRGSPLNLRRFSKPTIPTRGTTPSPVSSTTEEGETGDSNKSEYELEYEQESPPASSTTSANTTTNKPIRPGFGSKKPLSSITRPTARPSAVPSRNRAAATTPPPAVAQTTTRKIYTPRPRPAGFPKAVGPLARSTTTTPSPAHPDEEYYEEGEFEYQESGGGRGVGSVVHVQQVPLVLSINATEQRVSGGRLFIQNARDLRTKVMSNGVEVVVRGHKTALVGTPWLPQKVSPSRPVTLPGYTISRQFHLKDNPGKPANGIGQLLQSIVRSATADLVTKTMLTTFTYKTTILKKTNTIIKSHEEVVSNVMTQRFQSIVKVTPTERPATTTLPPDLFVSYLATSPYQTDTHYTTFVYRNTFTVGGLPMVLTSRETVSNVVTLPAYLATDKWMVSSTPAFETETHYSTYTFSKTMKDRSSEKVVTTRETVTQVVVTEELVPVRTPVHQIIPTNGITWFTTFTHLQTQLGAAGDLVVLTSTSVVSSVLKGEKTSISTLSQPTIMTTFAQTKTLTPVLLYATKILYTTYTYFTTHKHRDSTEKPVQIHSRTQVVSRVVTEALETAFDISYVNKLKSSYLSKHSTLLDVTSSVQEIIPTRTIDVIEGTGTLVTQQVIHPKWPKDDEQLTVEIEPSRTPPSVVERPIIPHDRPHLQPSLIRTPVISSSEEHFDEVKEGVQKVVSVLTNTKLTELHGVKFKPSRTHHDEYLVPRPTASIVVEDAPDAFVEEITLADIEDNGEDFTSITELSQDNEEDTILTERPVSHLATPPLRTSTERSEPTSKGPLKVNLRPAVISTFNKIPIMEQNVELDLFPEIGPPPKKPIIIDFPPEYDFPDDDDDIKSLVTTTTTRKSSSTALDKRKGSMTLSPSKTGGVIPTKEIFSLISEMTDVSDEDALPPKIYNIPTTFDTEAFNQQQKEGIIVKSTRNSTTAKPPPLKVDLILPVANNSTENDTGQSPDVETVEYEQTTPESEETSDEEPSDLTILEETLLSLGKNETSNEDTISNEGYSLNSTEISELENAKDEEEVDITTTTPIPSLTSEDEGQSTKNSTIADSEEELATIIPPTKQDEFGQEQESSKLDDLFDSEELAFISTGRPQKTTTRYTTSKRPTKKNKTKKPYRPSSLTPFSDEESGESSTNVYALAPVRFPSKDSVEESDEQKPTKDLNKDNSEEDSSESEESKKPKRRKPMPPINTSGYSGPSKSAISFPVAAGGTAIATAATNAFNWKPLLNLGAIGLGGLGAFGTTKLGPLFNSVAGYMKGAILPISRNDTQHNNNNNKLSYYKHNPIKSDNNNRRRPYYQLPPKEAPVQHHSDHIYIPLKNDNGNNNDPHSNYRFSDGEIIRRPVISHAQEPNFRPLANGREPDFVAGPLPPPVHHHYGIDVPTLSDNERFPPKHNYNFAPPHDNHPNIFTEQENGEYNNPPSLHKHGDPSPGPFLENNYGTRHEDDDGNTGPEGKTEFILRPLHNLINGKPPFRNNSPAPQRPSWITPVLRPTDNDHNSKPAGPTPFRVGQRPIYKPRPGPASIEMINEIKDSYNNRPPPYEDVQPSPEIFLPQRNNKPPSFGSGPPPQNNNNNNNNNNRLPPPPQGPLRINIPGLNLHSTENDNELPTPWHPKTPAGHERYNENPFKDGALNPPQLQNPRPANENTVQAASHESFESHFSQGAQKPFFNQQGFITRDHFNEIITTPKPLSRPPNQNFRPDDNNDSPFMIRPQMRPISPFHRPPAMEFDPPSDSLHNPVRSRDPPGNNNYFGQQFNNNNNGGNPNGVEKFRPEDHLNRLPQGPPFKPMSDSSESNFPSFLPEFDNHPGKPADTNNRPSRPEYFDPPLFSNIDPNHETGLRRPPSVGPPTRLPPWPDTGPGPGQLPGRFPSPMNIFDAPELSQNKKIPIIEQTVGNVQRIVDPPHIRRPPPLQPNPPSTVYIVEEQLHEDDDFDENNNLIRNHQTPVKNTLGDINNHKNVNDSRNLPPLVIKEVVKSPPLNFPKWKGPSTATTSAPTTTTSIPQTNNFTTTNRALISRLFIRRFTTTTPTPMRESSTPFATRILPPWSSKTRQPPGTSTTTTTSTPPSRTIPPFNTNLMNDLINFEEKFKQKYGTRKPITALSSETASSSHSQVVDKNLENEDEELNVSIYSEEEEDELDHDQDQASSTSNNGTGNYNDESHHPNHHPIHKPPIDVTKYLKDVDEDEFGQLYQGTEDKDTVVDPVNQKIIKSPHDQNRNMSAFMRRTTTEPSESLEATTTEKTYNTLSVSEEEDILRQFTVPQDLEFTSTPPANSNLWWPTTFRPNNKFNGVKQHPIIMDTPTTYRPMDNKAFVNDIQPAASNGISSRRPFLSINPNPRPAPQGGMASFYDDEESMGQIKMKNSEIHKLPTYIKRPNIGIALVKPEELQEYEKEISGEGSAQQGGNIREKLNKEADKIKEYPEFPEPGDTSSGQDISYEEKDKVSSSKASPPTTTVKNPTRIQVVRPHQPQFSQKSTPKIGPVKNQSTLVVVTTSGGGGNKNAAASSSQEVQIHVGDEGSDATGNGHRESSYIYEEEYYDDDEGGKSEENSENNVAGSGESKPRPPGVGVTPQGKIVFFPKARPTPPVLPPFHIAGHKVNSNLNFHQQQQQQHQQRLPPPPPHNNLILGPPPNQGGGGRFPPQIVVKQKLPLSGTGLRIFQNGNGGGILTNNLFNSLQQNVPKTEMEPPPIDSNRLKPPILELPSSGPIRYRPNNERDGDNGSGVSRPNLLRPDDDLFKPGKNVQSNAKSDGAIITPSTPTIIHTIASVDDFNKIVGTNTFTAIFPTKSETGNEKSPSSEISYDEDDDNSSPGGNGGANLEGSEINVVIPSHSEGTNTRLSSVIKYTGGRLQTTVIDNNNSDSLDEDDSEDDYYEETNTPIIQPSRTTSNIASGGILKTRGPGSNSSTQNVTQAPPSSTSKTRGTTTHATTTTVSNTTSRLITRRPQLPQILRFTTPHQTVNSPTTSKPVIRRPFIPTRGPGPNIVPWARRPQTSSTFNSGENNSSSTRVTTFSTPSTNRTESDSGSRRPTSTVVMSTTISNSSSSSEAKRYSPPTSLLPPFLRRHPFGGGSRGGGTSTSSSEEKSRVTTLVSRFVPTTSRPVMNTTTNKITTTTTRRSSIFQNTSISTSTPSQTGSSGSGSEEYEEYSYEEEVTAMPTKDGAGNSVEGKRENATVSVVTHVSEISPTRISSTTRVGGPRWKVSGPGSKSSEIHENVTVRYVTRSESITVTLTETEISSFTRNGLVQTETVLITKTIPPETLVSTIMGSVTLVNTLDIHPTVVKTTVFSEPTRIPVATTFFETSESSATKEHDRSSTERVNLSGLVTKGKLRPTTGPPRQDQSPDGNTPNHNNKHQFTVESSTCPSNCTLHPNQNLACRSYANATRSKCDCKPGFARMKAKYPCRPTFTYEMRLGINHMDGMLFDFKDLYNAATDGYLNFITITKEAIDKAFLATDIKRQFQGSEIIGIDPIKRGGNYSEPRVNVDFLVQLTTNITEDRIKNHLIRTLRTSNFSIGRTGVTSTRDFSDFAARDFNECDYLDYNDCSDNAECLNIRGSFSCKCKLGYKDKSLKRKPGRNCEETSGCGECSFRGTCHKDTAGNRTCHCFKWYGGTTCQINLKFLLIAITGIGSVLFILVMLCGTLVCKRTGGGGVPRRPERTGSGRFMRYRSPNSQTTLEQQAIMNDSASSDGRQSPHHIITHSFTPDSLLVDVDHPKVSGIALPGNSSRHHSSSDVNLINFSLRNVVMDSDRGMAVVIPRAKLDRIKTPSRPPSTHALNNSDILPDLASTEKKLINYLDQASSAHTSKHLNMLQNEHQMRKYSLQEQRKISQGALVSSGEAVSAIGGMRRRSTTALDPNETAYSAYTKSVSEVRSYDETIRCAAKPATVYTTDTASRASCYSCKPPSYCAYSESHGHTMNTHTMGDKDGASTVYTTQGKLFRMAHRHDDASSTASSQ